jgi:long-chain fatty acid transport protein
MMHARANRPSPLPVRLIVVLPLLSFALLAPRLEAQDFSFYDIGARAASLGGAFTAQADDITALFYNPAGLAFLDGIRIKTSLSFATRALSATWPGGQDEFTSSQNELIGNFFLSWQPFKGVTLGTGYYSPYGFDSVWPVGWSGELYSASAKFSAHTFRTALAVEPLEGLAFSAALDVVSMSVDWGHRLRFGLTSYPLPEEILVLSQHEAGGHGLGFAAGALWKVFSGLQVGARFQKSASVDLAGWNTFLFPNSVSYGNAQVPDPYGGMRSVTSLLDLFYVFQEVTGRLTLPREIACGIALRPLPQLSLNLDVEWDRWSEFGRWEFTSVDAGGDLSPGYTPVHEAFYGLSPDYGVQGFDLAVRDSKKLKAGVEYRLGRWFALRGGFARHESSVDPTGRTPLYPDPGFALYSFGAGYEGPLYSIWDDEKTVSRLSIEFFIRYAAADEAPSALPGYELTYGARRLVGGVGVGFIF